MSKPQGISPANPDRKAIEELVNQCLAAEGQNCEEHETEINHRVAKLYGLDS